MSNGGGNGSPRRSTVYLAAAFENAVMSGASGTAVGGRCVETGA